MYIYIYIHTLNVMQSKYAVELDLLPQCCMRTLLNSLDSSLEVSGLKIWEEETPSTSC